MQQSANEGWQQLGLITRFMSSNLSSMVTSVICKLSTLNFQLGRQLCESGLYLNERLYQMLADAQDKPSSNALVVKDFLSGECFNTVELKLAVRPLEARLELLAKQSFSYYREAFSKAEKIKNAIKGLQQIDKTGETVEEKLRSSLTTLKELSENKCFEQGKSRDAIDNAIKIITCFIPESKPQQHFSEKKPLTEHVREDYSPQIKPALTG